MSGLLGFGSRRTLLALMSAAAIAPWPAQAQVACVAGNNPQACVNPSGSTLDDVFSSNDGATIGNQGTVVHDLITIGGNSGISNSGDVGEQIETHGVNSGVTNTGSVGSYITTQSDNSGVSNSGSVGQFILTQGANSGVSNSGSVGGYIVTLGNDAGVTNTSSIAGYIVTLGINAGVSNSGSVGNYIVTQLDNSGVSNSGSVGEYITTLGINSGVSNSGSVGQYIVTLGINSGASNSGSVGEYIVTTSDHSDISNSGSVVQFTTTIGAYSSISNSGSVGQYITTLGDNSGVSNSGSVGENIATYGINSGVSNSGSVGTFIQTLDGNSDVRNSGSVGSYIQTLANDSDVSNSGTVGSNIQTLGANSDVINSGTVGTYIQTLGANASVTNSGSVGAGVPGDGIGMYGLDSTLTLLPGSVIQGQIILLGLGTSTLNVGNGLNVALTFYTPPTVINTFGAPYVQSGDRLVVVDATAMGQHDEMLADLTGGIFNSIHARLGGAGGSVSSGSGAMQLGMSGMMQLGGGSMMNLSSADISPSDARDTSREALPRRGGLWAQAFGGLRNEDDERGTVGSDTKYFGGIAGIDGQLRPGVIIGAFGGASNAKLDVDFEAQKLDADSYFGGGYVSFQRYNVFARLMLTAGQSNYGSRRRVANNVVAGGIENAHASFGGTFVSPELTVGTQFNIAGWTVEPSARGRYAHLSLDGYSERGVVDNLSTGDRDVSLWLGRLQVAFPVTVDGATLAPRFGVEAWTSDSDRVSAVLLGEAISFSPGGDDNEVTGFVGATATVSLGAGAAAYFDSEVHFGDGGVARSEARGGIKISF